MHIHVWAVVKLDIMDYKELIKCLKIITFLYLSNHQSFQVRKEISPTGDYVYTK